MFKGEDLNPPMPVISGMEHLIKHLNIIGWSSSNGMGITSISFQEIEAYNNLTKSHLSPDEVLILKNMSVSYCREVQDKDPHKKAPYQLPKN